MTSHSRLTISPSPPPSPPPFPPTSTQLPLDRDGSFSLSCDSPRVLIVAANASLKFGGEAAIPLQIFRRLRARGVEAFLATHARNRDELLALLGEAELPRLLLATDTRLNRLSARHARSLPGPVHNATLGLLSRLSTFRQLRRIALDAVRTHRLDVVHQPTPVSPREFSPFYDLSAPVVMGPMNGNMTFPPALAHTRRGSRLLLAAAQAAALPLHWLFPGKLRAAVLLVANDRTRAALPKAVRPAACLLVENGVDTALWKPPLSPPSPPSSPSPPAPFRFVFLGRFETWKGIDLLLHAFARVQSWLPAHLTLIGDGHARRSLEALTARLGLREAVEFTGFLSQPRSAEFFARSHCFVFPSFGDCGGAVVLEAMSAGLPVVALDWGGPPDYLDAGSGVLVPPGPPEAVIAGFTDAMLAFARDPARAREMGQAARRRAVAHFDWERKIDQLLAIYRSVLRPAPAAPQP